MAGTYEWDRGYLTMSRPMGGSPSFNTDHTITHGEGWNLQRVIVSYDWHAAWAGQPDNVLHQPAPLAMYCQLGVSDDINSPEVIDQQYLPMSVTYFNKEGTELAGYSYDWIGVFEPLRWDQNIRRSFGSYGGGPLVVGITLIPQYFDPNFALLLFPEIEGRGHYSILWHRTT